MTASRTARDRTRAELTREIKEEARRQLAVNGVDRLSLRSVARRLGMVSSALYRYFPSKDDLLTALIIDAYNSLADAAEAALGTGGVRDRWLSVCHAIRDWAKARPHEYALIYGSPVPGYKAPQDTVRPASRVALLLVRLAHEADSARALEPLAPGPPLTANLAAQVAAVAEQFAPGMDGDVLARVVVAWTQLFGMISFELFGQLVGSVDPADEFFDYACLQMADFIGLRSS